MIARSEAKQSSEDDSTAGETNHLFSFVFLRAFVVKILPCRPRGRGGERKSRAN
jgi:hypothetical protein